MDAPIRLAVVGTGGMGRHQINIFKELPDCEIVAVCDVNGESAESAASEIGPNTKSFSNLDELFASADFEAITIALPTAIITPSRFGRSARANMSYAKSR